MQDLVVVYGPTAVGKTSTSIALAKALGTEIVSADSRQVFREMRIGTAYPSAEELAAIPHHLVGHRSIRERYSCGQYENEALGVLRELFTRHDVALLTGGSMLYLDAVCYGMDAFPPPDPEIRARLTNRLQEEGVAILAEELRDLDPVTHARVDLSNGARVLRALEICLQTGRPYSQFLGQEKVPRPFRLIKLGLNRSWEELCARIDQRVDQMLAQGLEDEARRLLPYQNVAALRTVGYSEFFAYFAGKLLREEVAAKIKTNTRRYARKQLKWWRRDAEIRWFYPDETDVMLEHIARARAQAKT